jgi:hypothetical protein
LLGTSVSVKVLDGFFTGYLENIVGMIDINFVGPSETGADTDTRSDGDADTTVDGK